MMDAASVELTVREVLAEKLNVDKNKISLDSDLVNDLGMDSFGSIEVIFELEEKLAVKIADDDIKDVKKVRDIVDYVSTLTEKSA